MTENQDCNLMTQDPEPWSPGFGSRVGNFAEEKTCLSKIAEPWSPGFQTHHGDLDPWAGTQLGIKPGEKEPFRLTLSTIDTLSRCQSKSIGPLSPRHSNGTYAPWSPGVLSYDSWAGDEDEPFSPMRVEKTNDPWADVEICKKQSDIGSMPTNFEPWSPGFMEKLEAGPEEKPVLAPGLEPWSPGFQLKGGPWTACRASSCPATNPSEDFAPWSPGFLQRANTWSDENVSKRLNGQTTPESVHSWNDNTENNVGTAQDDTCNQEALNDQEPWSPGFKERISGIFDEVQQDETKQPHSQSFHDLSPTLSCNPWLDIAGTLASPILAPASPCLTQSSDPMSQPLSPLSPHQPWSPEICFPDPWADIEHRFNRGSTRGFGLSKLAIATVAVLLAGYLMHHRIDAHVVLAMLSAISYECALLAAVVAVGFILVCKFYFKAESEVSEVLSPRSPCAPSRAVAVLGFFEGLLRYCNAQTLLKQMTSRISEHDNFLTFGKKMVVNVLSDILAHFPRVIPEIGFDNATKSVENIMRLSTIASFDVDTAAKHLKIMTLPGSYDMNMTFNLLATPRDKILELLEKHPEPPSEPPPHFKTFKIKPHVDISSPSASNSMPSNFPPVSEIVFPKGCHVTHFSEGGRFEVLEEIKDYGEGSWFTLRNVKTFEEVVHPKTQLKKIANENLEPRSMLIAKLKDGHVDGLDTRSQYHLGMHFAVLAQISYASLPEDCQDVPVKGNLVDEIFGDVSGCAEFLKYDRDVQVYSHHESSLQALKFESKDEIVIAIRGTIPEPLAKGTWFGPNLETDVNHRPTYHSRYGFVHGGFWSASRTFWCETDLARFLSDHRKYSRPPKRLYFVGHSLGASLALLMARFARDDPSVKYPPKRIEVHTFGCAPTFFVARKLKYHKQYSEGKDDHELALARTHGGVVDWDPRRNCEPVKIHHQRWLNEDDIVPNLGDSLLWKWGFCRPYIGYFHALHPDEPTLLPGSGHGVMSYYDAIKKKLSNMSLDTQRVSVQLRKSVTSLLGEEDLEEERRCSSKKQTFSRMKTW